MKYLPDRNITGLAMVGIGGASVGATRRGGAKEVLVPVVLLGPPVKVW